MSTAPQANARRNHFPPLGSDYAGPLPLDDHRILLAALEAYALLRKHGLTPSDGPAEEGKAPRIHYVALGPDGGSPTEAEVRSLLAKLGSRRLALCHV